MLNGVRRGEVTRPPILYSIRVLLSECAQGTALPDWERLQASEAL